MSGNSVAIGTSAAVSHWADTALRAWPVLMYIAGVLACRIIIEAAARRAVRRIAWFMFGIEIALLAAAELRPALYAGIALLAVAMGIQNGALTRFGALTLNTGFVTGTLVKFAEQFSKYLFWLYDRGSVRNSFGQHSFQNSVWLAAVWIAYVIGAVLGAFADARWALPALAVPMVALLALSAFDLRHPLAVADEREQLLPG